MIDFKIIDVDDLREDIEKLKQIDATIVDRLDMRTSKYFGKAIELGIDVCSRCNRHAWKTVDIREDDALNGAGVIVFKFKVKLEDHWIRVKYISTFIESKKGVGMLKVSERDEYSGFIISSFLLEDFAEDYKKYIKDDFRDLLDHFDEKILREVIDVEYPLPRHREYKYTKSCTIDNVGEEFDFSIENSRNGISIIYEGWKVTSDVVNGEYAKNES